MPYQPDDEEETTKFLPSEHIGNNNVECRPTGGKSSTLAAGSLPRFSGVTFHAVAFTVNIVLLLISISLDSKASTMKHTSSTAVDVETGNITHSTGTTSAFDPWKQSPQPPSPWRPPPPPPQPLQEAIARKNTTTTTGYIPYDKIFGHVHMAKTGGTEINGELAAHFERVCGHKGYSYDAYRYNQRAQASNQNDPAHAGGPDLISYKYHKFSRGRVEPAVMREIGFEDCDYVSLEESYNGWRSISKIWPLELHVPCRKPLDHLMSLCNYFHQKFNCMAKDLKKEVTKCMKYTNRFSKGLLKFSNVSLRCFNPIPMDPYLEYMSQYLQRKRIETEYFHRETNKPRNKTNECLWTNQTAADRVLKILLKYDYYSFCDKCMGSKNDLLGLGGR